MHDKDIIRLLKKRNPDGLEALVNKYKRLLCSIALAIVGKSNIEDALECVNDAFYDIWRSFDSFDDKRTSLKGWAAVITRRRAIDRLRRNSRHISVPVDDFTADIISAYGNPEDSFSSKEDARMLSNFVESLSPMDRNVFVCRFFILESINVIAERYGVSRAAVDNRLKRIRTALHEYLERSQ